MRLASHLSPLQQISHQEVGQNNFMSSDSLQKPQNAGFSGDFRPTSHPMKDIAFTQITNQAI